MDETLSLDEALLKLIRGRARRGVALKGLRTRYWLRQRDVAKKLHVDQSTVSKMESGLLPIKRKVAKKLASIFNTDYRIFL